MNQNKEVLSNYIKKYLDNQISAEEYQQLWRLLNEPSNDGLLDDELRKLWESTKAEPPMIAGDVWDSKMLSAKEKLNVNKPQARVQTMHPFKKYRWVAAAIFLIIASALIVFNLSDTKNTNTNNATYASEQDRMPGGDRAVLTLSDGRTILLDSAGNGILAQQGSTNIVKKTDGQIVYNSEVGQSNEVVFNMLQTPRGGQYKITLPDGTKVWLNAASSLKYPVEFVGNERRVEISGEAYFEVAKNATKPFKVQLNNMEVEVLGTHFNINGYTDEDDIRTTLLEGRVKVTAADKSKLLQPGQQAQLNTSGNIYVANDVDLEEVVAWKDGNFQFENSDIKTVMRQLARWYDVEVSYKGAINKHFVGSISRNVKLSQVLSMLQQTGEVKFKIEGKNLIVMP